MSAGPASSRPELFIIHGRNIFAGPKEKMYRIFLSKKFFFIFPRIFSVVVLLIKKFHDGLNTAKKF